MVSKRNKIWLFTCLLNFAIGNIALGKAGALNTVIVYKDTPTGNRFRQAIEETVMANPDTVGSVIKIIKTHPYSANETGVNYILKSPKSDNIDLVFGPTESDLFVALSNKRTELNNNRVPIVSSQITVKLPVDSTSWLFRTNVSAVDRAKKLANYLNKFWSSSIISIYADTEYGRSSEYALQKALLGIDEERLIPLSYKAYSFQNTLTSIEEQVLKVQRFKPEVVAIFAEREELLLLSRAFKEITHTTYNPMFVTNLDARMLMQLNRSSTETFDKLLFVSLLSNKEQNNLRDDIIVQAEAMTLMVAQLINRITNNKKPQSNLELRQYLQSELKAVLSGDVGLHPPIQGLRFRNNENTFPLSINSLSHGKIEAINPLQELNYKDQFNWKYKLVESRFGVLPTINIILIILITLFINWQEVRNWHKGSIMALIKAYPFWLLWAFSSFVTVCLYIILSESGAIKYDNPITAIIVALTPAAFLNATLFNTKTGKSIGLKGYYNDFLQFLHRRMMYKRYQADESIINIIAYSNPATRLKTTLLDLYENARDDNKLLIEAKIKKAYESNIGWRERRRILSRLVYSELDWADIVKKGLIPQETGVSTKFHSTDNVTDPEALITLASRKITHNEQLKTKLDHYIATSIKKISYDNRKNDILAMLEEAESCAISEQDFIERKLRVLLVLKGYSETNLVNEWLDGIKPKLNEIKKVEPEDETDQAAPDITPTKSEDWKLSKTLAKLYPKRTSKTNKSTEEKSLDLEDT